MNSNSQSSNVIAPWLYWQHQLPRNLGDRLSPMIFQLLSGTYPRYVPPDHHQPYYSMIGSHLSSLQENAIVFGTGILRSDEVPDPRANYLAVRGPLSREAVLKAGGQCDEVYGDPACLLPKFLSLPKCDKRTIGIALHWRERKHIRLPEFVIDLDIGADTLEFLLRLSRCEYVFSSSLHGLILAHAYGIPACWMKVTDMPLGDGTKFKDYLLSIGMKPECLASNALNCDLCALPPIEIAAGLHSAWINHLSSLHVTT